MLTTILPFRFHSDVGADHYKTAAAEGWGNLLDHPAPAGHAAAYQHNQTDLEFLRAELRAVGKADAIGVRWEGPDFDACFNLGPKA